MNSEAQKAPAQKKKDAQDQWVRDVLELGEDVEITEGLLRKARRRFRRMEIKGKQNLSLQSWVATVEYNGEVGRAQQRPVKAAKKG